MKTTWITGLCLCLLACSKQDVTPTPDNPPPANAYYFPPVQSDTWESVTPQSLGWDAAQLDQALQYAASKQTYGLIILHKGRIVTEQYWNNWNRDTKYFIASAGKSVTAFLTGIAQQEGKLSIQDKTSRYLGVGWTSAPREKEDLITIRHQLTMTTGLDEQVPDDNCISPDCLKYKADAGTQWFYYNAPYRLVQDVIAKATGTNFNEYTKIKLAEPIGMKNHTWFNYVLWLNTRDMARFGLLVLNKGDWNGKAILSDKNYFNQMVSSSNIYNRSYGYLWWLNGQSSFMVPTLYNVFNGELSPDAPADMISALGKGDKKIYVIPSLDLVVVRHGDETGESTLGPSSFDNEFWKLLLPAIK